MQITIIADTEVEIDGETVTADLIIENAQGRWYGVGLGLNEYGQRDWDYLQDNGEYIAVKQGETNMAEHTIYRITAEADAYGPGCVNPRACAEAIRDKLIEYSRRSVDPLFDVEIVDETESFGNRSTGNVKLIAYLDEIVEKYWGDWVPMTAFNA